MDLELFYFHVTIGIWYARANQLIIIMILKPFKEEAITTWSDARCNNRNDLANLSFILKVSAFSEAYSERSRASMMKLFVKIAESRELFLQKPGAVVLRCSVKKVFLEISQNSQENNICTRVSFSIKLQAWMS